jgi:hypothetical protein
MTDTIFHWFKEKYPVFLNVSMILLFVDVMVDPTNLIFHVKYVLFGLLLIMWVLGNFSKKLILPRYLWFILLFISFFMPFYELSVGLINSAIHNIPVGNMVYFNSFFFFVIILVTVSEKMNLTAVFNYSSLSIVVMTLGLFLVLIFNTRLFSDMYRYFVTDKHVVVYALRDYGKITLLMIFYKTSPLLVFPLSYYLYQLLIVGQKKKVFINILLLLLVSLTLYFSGTRANMLSLILIILFYIGFYLYRRSKVWFVWAVALGVLVALFMLPSITAIFLNKQETSNAVKFGYLASYSGYFDHHLLSLLLGQGVGGMFYASGLHRFIDVSELTYLELIRVWGVPVSLMFIGILTLPLLAELRTKKITHLFIAYLAYLFISGTNPLLLSSTGMLVLVYVFTYTFLNSGYFRSIEAPVR